MVIIWTIKIWGLPNFEDLKPLLKWLNYWASPTKQSLLLPTRKLSTNYKHYDNMLDLPLAQSTIKGKNLELIILPF